MFEKLDKTYYDGRLVKGVFHPEDETGTKHFQVGLEFGDDKEPETEVMHTEEWEVMKSEDQEASLNRADKFQDATDGVQGRILRELEAFNPRWAETINIIQRVADRVNQIKEEFINEAYGVSDFMTNLTLKHVSEMLKKHEKELDVSGLSPFEVEFVELCQKHDVTIDSLQRMSFLQKLNMRINEWQVQALEAHLGRPVSTWRVDDIVQTLEQKYLSQSLQETEKEV